MCVCVANCGLSQPYPAGNGTLLGTISAYGFVHPEQMMWPCMIYAARRQLCTRLGCDVGASLCASAAQGRSLMRR